MVALYISDYLKKPLEESSIRSLGDRMLQRMFCGRAHDVRDNWRRNIGFTPLLVTVLPLSHTLIGT